MAVWRYKGKTPTGRDVEGEIEAPGADEARALLRKKRLIVGELKKRPIEFNINFSKGISVRELARFTRQFSTMNAAGLPLMQALDTLLAQSENPNLKKALVKIISDIQGGANMAEAFRKHPALFSDLYCHMLQAGEASGAIDKILLRLADYLEKTDRLIGKIKKAMYYPVFVMLISVIVIVVLMLKVVPTFAALFGGAGKTLPPATAFVLGISTFLQNWFYVLFIVAGLIAFVFRWWYRTPAGRYSVDKALLYGPVIGDLVRKSSVSRFTRTLSTLLESGVSIIDSLRITSRTAGNKVLEEAILTALDNIAGGQSISDPLKATGVFPPMVIQMIAVGEKTGQLDKMLSKVSDFFDEEVDAAVDGLTSLMEPAIIVLLGGVIGGVLIAMYLPMFDMASTVG